MILKYYLLIISINPGWDIDKHNIASKFLGMTKSVINIKDIERLYKDWFMDNIY